MSATAAVPRALRVEPCMGTVFTVDIRDPGEWTGPLEEVVGWLHHVDAVFSTYREDSDISRLRAGTLTLEAADPAVAEVLDLCAQLQLATDGYFSARWRDGLDPTGLVKGWAIERASDLLRSLGSRNHAVNGGGDMQLAGESSPGQAWRVGITDPADATRVVCVVAGSDCAIATSGVAERGSHIIDPFTGRAATDLRSVTVLGRSLTVVDAYATAAFAMGPAALGWLGDQAGYEGLVVDRHGAVTQTPGWPG